MPTSSRRVHSAQTGPHPDIERVVRRHLDHPWHQPLHFSSSKAWDRFAAWRDPSAPLIVDSGCGTGASTAGLAVRNPEAQVVGIDRSAARLSRAPEPLPSNCLLIRARLEDFWRLLVRARIPVSRHFLLYPNPSPKPAHLKRRWHAHPVWPILTGLGGELIVRSNWRIYLDEMRLALRMCRFVPTKVLESGADFSIDSPLSPFERKYAASGHALFELSVRLENPTCTTDF